MSSNDAHSPAGAAHPAPALPRPEIPVREDVPPRPDESAFSRRTALKVLSLGALLGATAGCTRKPLRHIISVVDRPEYQHPGIPLYYASTWTEGSTPYGILVKQIDGRPVKVDGLEGHPLSAGRSTAAMQASIYTLYEPTRLRGPRQGNEDVSWQDVDQRVGAALAGASSVVLVTRPNLGPSEKALVKRFLGAVRGGRHLTYEPGQDRTRRLVWQRVYGAPGIVTTRLENARVIFSLDSDFLGSDGDVLTNTRGFASTRNPDVPGAMSRLYVAEGGMTVTGSNADHRIPLRPSTAMDMVGWLSAAVQGRRDGLKDLCARHGWDAQVLTALADDLTAHPGEAAVLAGPHLPAAVHAAVARLNGALGAMGHTLGWNPEPGTALADDPAEVMRALAAGPDVALLLGVNPVHEHPGGGFAAALAKARLSVAHGMTANETLRAVHLALPSAHNLECWNDAAPLPGLKTVCQPMIAPLYDGRQEAESLLAWTRGLDHGLAAVPDFHAFLRSQWGLSQEAWDDVLRKGMLGTPREATAKAGPADFAKPATGADGTYDLVLAHHPITGDGRFAANPWLLETPEPCSKLTWDNAAVVAPETAHALGVEMGDVLTVAAGGASVDLPVMPLPGVQRDTVVVHAGFGRSEGAGLANGVGRSMAAFGAAGTLVLGATLKPSGSSPVLIARTQRVFDENFGGDERHIVQEGTLSAYAQEGRKLVEEQGEEEREPPQINAPWDYSQGHKWAMAIDMNRCTGCHACTVACQAENNIAVVGKEEVSKGREMCWIRIDRYLSGDDANPQVSQQVMLCQQCDNAPCEMVCPVNATSHSPEGLNMQVYNRCVGTRYCSNNCPYKVRRFNFFNYSEHPETPEEELRNNPHVTVRMRGVMEKCTFCIQRINAVKFAALNKGVPVKDGDIVTACQQACPADAIVFGDVNVPGGHIEKARAHPLAYHVLEELNVRPNVTYRARIRNPNPSLEAEHEKGGGK
jgi:molybdopterin-containing oxidoreductase family iron-sulfur binding subunit